MSLPRPPRSLSRPKLRAIPRKQTEPLIYAELQQLTVERQRLQQELDYMREREVQVQLRLEEIQQMTKHLKSIVGIVEGGAQVDFSASPQPTIRKSTDTSHSAYSPMTFEY